MLKQIALTASFLLLSPFSLASEYVCTTQTANLRAEATTHGQLLSKLKKYTPLKVLSRTGQWLQVETPGYKGFVYHTLVSDEFKCMMITNANSPYCSGKKSKLGRKVQDGESFKIIKEEIGCNYVQGKWGHKVWLSSVNIWPTENAMRITF
jgi:uncharacterized protein YgiM (DUF1202 family)